MKNLSRLQRLRRNEEILRKEQPINQNVDPADVLSTVVIGNGKSANTGNKGKAIDKYDNVFRFNQFEIAGYEKNIGTKITHWAINQHCLNNYEIIFRQICRNEKYLRDLKYIYLKMNPSENVTRLFYSFFDNIQIEILYDGYKRDIDLNIMRMPPSLGTRLLYDLNIDPYIEKPIGVHGIDFIEGLHGHYNDDKYEATHDIASEQTWLSKLIQNKKIVKI
jgi:hypothetical protein